MRKFTPTANFDLYLIFGNADFGLHGVYHVTYETSHIICLWCSLCKTSRITFFNAGIYKDYNTLGPMSLTRLTQHFNEEARQRWFSSIDFK